MLYRVPLDRLFEEQFARIICYPRYDASEFADRIREMRNVGVKALSFTGNKKIGNIPVLGKGHVGIVVLAHLETGRAALKIRRTDADRESMRREARMLQIANSVNVGPRLMASTRNLLLMEFVGGLPFPEWVKSVCYGENAAFVIRKVVKSILERCRRLDEVGLDHGELSRAPKHIIVDREGNPWILDFETASTMRRVSNVTSICQFLLLRGETADLIREAVGFKDRDRFTLLLRRYKRNRTKGNFDEILKALGLSD
jgi:putative serine/threonine protein kinase